MGKFSGIPATNKKITIWMIIIDRMAAGM